MPASSQKVFPISCLASLQDQLDVLPIVLGKHECESQLSAEFVALHPSLPAEAEQVDKDPCFESIQPIPFSYHLQVDR